MTRSFPATRRTALQSLLVASLAPSALAQARTTSKAVAWPTQPIKLLIGFPAGSVQDLSARAISPGLAAALGQSVIVDNKAGASGTIAADMVSKANDSHTFGVMNNSQLTVAKLLSPKIGYDPARDLAPIALIGTTPLLLVVSAAAPGLAGSEHLHWLRQLGEQGNYGSPGIGTPGHLGMELLKSRASLQTTHIPYPGNPQVINAIIGGQLQAGLMPPGLAMQQVRAGKLKAVGVTSEQRSLFAPDLPTLRELDVRGAELELWSALAGPAGLAPAIVEKLATAVISVVKDQETRERLLSAGWQPTPSNYEGLAQRMRADTRTMGGIITLRNIRAEG